MQFPSLLLFAGVVAVAQSQDTGAETFGGLEPVIPTGQWIPVTDSYSNGPYDAAIYLSFDGMHQFDLTRYIATHPDGNFAKIINNAVVYSNARANAPSDSLPATAALFSGASSRNTGIYWETSYDRELYPPGSNCIGLPGTVCDYSEAINIDNAMLDGGGGFNTSLLPLKKTAWGTCEFVYPHNFIRTNTVFEVGRGNGLVTAYADKHLAYEFVNGPSGIGLTQGYFPEIASVNGTLEAQEAWDDLHWSALRNWTQGNWVNGTKNPAGQPSIYGANFQAITFAQQNYGYLDGVGTPSPELAAAFDAADSRLGTFLDDLANARVQHSTLVLIGSKQGQGPIDPKTLVVTDPQTVIDGASVPVAYFVGEDGGIMWLQDPSQAATAKANLLANSSLGIAYVLIGDEITLAGYGSPFLDSRVPDLIIGAKVGTLWNVGFEFADHGGFLPQDLDVPLIAYNPSLQKKNITEVVSNRQVASTLLFAVGLLVDQLEGYRLGEAPVLPELF
ncbi:alkaline phosphatase-like protein [Hyaloscypha hepaticicola]|uniref:Alkaline phosphatase-like protein n=1 Tax=Hyaloscypha hepaticicola TaxID=2082293 RepID=A0A2J6PQD7_9HELO|nr:alkaline phosphatase-like protein [Hyaloscypha hepaticicola]